MLIFDQVRKSDRELRWVAFGVLLGMGTLLAGLWYVQIIRANRYRAELQDQSIRTVRVPAIRGKILDRNGYALAENRPCYNVNSYLEELRGHFYSHYINHVKKEFTNASPKVALTRKLRGELERQARYQVVSNLLLQASLAVRTPRILLETEFNRHYQQDLTLPLPLLRDLSKPQVAMFAEQAASLPSLALEPQALRHYPFRTNAAHIIGHLRREDDPVENEDIAFRFRLPDYVGVKGLEWAFDSKLRGKAGVKLVLVNNLAYRQSEEVPFPASPGQDVQLTIDLSIQQAAEKALAEVEPNVRGAVVVMDTNTGELYAIVSAPSFNPNDFVTRLTPEEAARLNDPLLTPMFNRAMYGTYPPGSSFKIIVALAALEAGMDPKEIYLSKGYYQFRRGSRRISDTAGEGSFDFERAFYKSSNPYFIEHGLRVGPEKIVEMARRFHLGEPTGLWPAQEASGLLPPSGELKRLDGSTWTRGDTENFCIGHGELLVTPLQMAVVTAAIGNGGKILQPRLVSQIEPQPGSDNHGVTQVPSGQVRGTINVSSNSLNLVQKAMLADVAHPDGTGKNARVAGVSIAAKTGTARLTHGRKETITWFVSYASIAARQYAVVVVIEGERGDSGGGTCGPVARKIYEAILKRDRAQLPNAQTLAHAEIEDSPRALTASGRVP